MEIFTCKGKCIGKKVSHIITDFFRLIRLLHANQQQCIVKKKYIEIHKKKNCLIVL